MCVGIDQSSPHGAVLMPKRSPQNWSTSTMTVARVNGPRDDLIDVLTYINTQALAPTSSVREAPARPVANPSGQSRQDWVLWSLQGSNVLLRAG
jgi:hypothetical protein